MKIRLIICSLILSFTQLGLMAQNNKKSVQEKSSEDKSFILTDISYINDAVFMGRQDSIAAPYIFPSIGYYDKSGFYADASASYLTSSGENRVDLFLISAGYLFNVENLSGGLSGTKYFFNGDSYNVKSEILGDISGFLGYDLKVVEISVLASTYFNDGSSADIFGGLMLNRTFYTSDNNILIDPSVAVYAGSQYFYQEYYSTSRLGNRKGRGQGSGGSGSAAPSMIEIEEVSKFNVLAVELGLSLQYYHESFIFSFTPVLALPQSGATITTEDTVITEDLENVFYFSVGIGYGFRTRKNQL